HPPRVPGQRLSGLWCRLSKKTTDRLKTERSPPRKAMVRRKRAMAPLEQRTTVPRRKAVTLVARPPPVRWTEALALTKAATPPLEWIPALVHQEQAPRKSLRQMPGFGRLSGRHGLKTVRSGGYVQRSRGAWPRD